MNIDIHPSFPANVPQDRRKGRVIGGQLPPPWLEFQGSEEWTYFCHPTMKVLTSADPRDPTNNAALLAVGDYILQALPGRRPAAHMDIIIELSDGLQQAWYYLVHHRDRIVPLEIVEHLTSDGGHSDHCISNEHLSPWTRYRCFQYIERIKRHAVDSSESSRMAYMGRLFSEIYLEQHEGLHGRNSGRSPRRYGQHPVAVVPTGVNRPDWWLDARLLIDFDKPLAIITLYSVLLTWTNERARFDGSAGVVSESCSLIALAALAANFVIFSLSPQLYAKI
ncbi:hypothetical protein FRB90_008343, partial [Tulasnella sp. 427]